MHVVGAHAETPEDLDRERVLDGDDAGEDRVVRAGLARSGEAVQGEDAVARDSEVGERVASGGRPATGPAPLLGRARFGDEALDQGVARRALMRQP